MQVSLAIIIYRSRTMVLGVAMVCAGNALLPAALGIHSSAQGASAHQKKMLVFVLSSSAETDF